jgi:hypothetical protein
MQLPFDFGIKFIFRMIFRGVMLAAALVPAIHGILHALGFSIKFEYLFPIEVILWGWLIVINDELIYMLFEGRRYWPSPIRKLLIWFQRRRLNRLRKIAFSRSPSIDRRRSLEAGVEYGLYPTDEHGEAFVEHPTRLGNIIESFESYSNVKYGLDSVFYWYRLWVVLDKDLREEIDSSQAVVDSTVYVSFVLYVSAFVMLVYAGIEGAPHLHRSYLSWLSAVKLPYVPAPGTLCAMAAACLVIAFAVYRLSLPTHAKFGELFKSVFDQYRSKLVFDDVLKTIARIMDVPSLTLKSQREKNQMVWRYLRWHRIRDEATKNNMTPKEWEDRRNPPGPAGAP